jgi:hypothetical protein
MRGLERGLERVGMGARAGVAVAGLAGAVRSGVVGVVGVVGVLKELRDVAELRHERTLGD